MLSTIGTWLAKEGLTLVLGFVANMVTTALKDWQANQAQRQLGQATAERDQAIAGRDAAERVAKAAVDPLSEVDVLNRMDGGKG